MEVKSNKLQTKDLINVGIFTAIYFVIFFAGMMLGYIPIFIPLLGLVCPILCGIPFMLYLTKVKKFGMVSLTGIILGLLNLIMGSGVLVLEELEHARARGAHIYAEVVGYGANCDAYHFTAPAPGGTGAIDCMKLTLADAGIAPEQVDHINAHGTGTHMNDACETAAIHAVFGEHAKQLTVVSTKSMTGHLLGGAGGIEAVFTALALRDQFAPPTIHYEQPDPECDLDYVPNAGRAQAMTYALSNSLGFGGHNACIALRRWEG